MDIANLGFKPSKPASVDDRSACEVEGELNTIDIASAKAYEEAALRPKQYAIEEYQFAKQSPGRGRPAAAQYCIYCMQNILHAISRCYCGKIINMTVCKCNGHMVFLILLLAPHFVLYNYLLILWSSCCRMHAVMT